MRHFLFFVFIMCAGAASYAQCENIVFSLSNESKICRQSPVSINNVVSGGNDRYWDFCPETFSESPTNTVNPVSGLANVYGFKMIHHGGLWYGFMVSRSLNKLYRLDYGSDPESIPVVNDLGNPGGFFSFPEGIDFYKEGTDWYAFIGKGDNVTGQVVKLFFGNSLENTPTASSLGTFGLGSVRIRDLKVVKQSNDIILLALVYNTSVLNRVNFGSSLANTPSANNTVALTGLTLPRGMSIASYCPWRVQIVSEGGIIQQLSFGTNILSTATVEGNFIFTSVVQPWRIQHVYSGGKNYAFVSNNNRKYSIIDFGDLTLSTSPSEITSSNDVRYISFDVFKHKGKVITIGGGANVASLTNIAYSNQCSAGIGYSEVALPQNFKFGNAGTSLIDLTVQGEHHEKYYGSRSVVVKEHDAPAPLIVWDSQCTTGDVHFSLSSESVFSSVKWKFGNDLVSTSQLPSVTYVEPGEYEVSFSAETSECFVSESTSIKIYDPPTADFSLPSGSICTSTEYVIENLTPDAYDGLLSYKWYVDNIAVATSRDLAITFSQQGDKQIALKTSIPGCSHEVEKAISDVAEGPTVEFQTENKCSNETIRFVNESAGAESYHWKIGEHASTENTVELTLDPGVYVASLTGIGSNGCVTTTSSEVTIYQNPEADFHVASPAITCENTTIEFVEVTDSPYDIASWSWSFASVGTSDLQFPSFNFPEAGAKPVTLEVVDVHGCRDAIEKDIEILPTPSVEIGHTSLCIGIPVNFSSSADLPVGKWSWQIAEKKYGSSKPSHTFRAPGDYNVSLTATGINGCASTIGESVHIFPALTPTFASLRNCVNQETVLSDVTTTEDPVTEWNWKIDNLFFAGEEIRYTFNETGEYDVELAIVTNSGCSFKAVAALEIVDAPFADFTPSSTVSAPENEFQFLNTSLSSTSFQWDFGDGNFSSDLSPAHAFTRVGTYTVQLSASNDFGCSSSLSRIVHVTPTSPDVEILAVETTELPDDSREISLVIQNKGNTILQGLKVDIDVSGAITLTETVEEKVMPLARFNMKLTYGVKVDKLEFICAQAIVENDVAPDDNRNCVTIDSEKPQVLPLYPNPAVDDVAVEWLNSGTSDHTTLTVLNQIGLIVQEFNLESKDGLNRQVIDLSTVEGGIYLIVIRSGSFVSTQRVILSH